MLIGVLVPPDVEVGREIHNRLEVLVDSASISALRKFLKHVKSDIGVALEFDLELTLSDADRHHKLRVGVSVFKQEFHYEHLVVLDGLAIASAERCE